MPVATNSGAYDEAARQIRGEEAPAAPEAPPEADAAVAEPAGESSEAPGAAEGSPEAAPDGTDTPSVADEPPADPAALAEADREAALRVLAQARDAFDVADYTTALELVDEAEKLDPSLPDTTTDRKSVV